MFVVPTAVPANFLTTAITPTIINVSWYPPPIYFQNGVITNYTLTYIGVQRDKTLKNVTVSVVNGTYVLPILTGLQENTDYSITLRANTIVGPGPTVTLYQLTLQEGELLLLFLLYCIPSVSIRSYKLVLPVML